MSFIKYSLEEKQVAAVLAEEGEDAFWTVAVLCGCR